MITATEPTRDSWLAERQTGLGGSDAPIVLGVAPESFGTPYSLWSEKSGLAEPDDLSDNERIEWGVSLEPVIAEKFAAKTGREVQLAPRHEVVRHADIDWMTCTPDAIQHKRDGASLVTGNLQIKTSDAYLAYRWEAEPPLYVQVQVQHEMAVTGLSWSSVVVLIGGNKLKYWDIERNDRFIDSLIPRLEAFWDLVKSGTPPEVDGSKTTARSLSKLYPADDGSVEILPTEAAEWDATLVSAQTQIAELQKQEQLAKNRIREAMGEAKYGLLVDGTQYSLKPQARNGSTFRVLRRKAGK